MPPKNRPYLYYDTATSVCATCLKKTEGKILFEDDKVYLTKRCREHGAQRVLIADDIDYYKRAREVFVKAPEMPARFNTAIEHGCPYDCGLCPDHEQHSCLSVVEIAEACNLDCPICYAESSTKNSTFYNLAQVERMLDAVVTNEIEPDVVQISGGEPTIHPQFFEILDAAKRRPIRHLMVNTNGIELAKDRSFVERLASYAPGFEIYLQFDSLKAEAQKTLRGADLRQIKERALQHLDEFNLSTTLVATVQKGTNDDELGAIIEHALQHRSVRGVTFQPVQHAGRAEGYDPAIHRLTLTEVRRRILEQSDLFRPEDILPVPCHPDALAMAYAMKTDTGIVPLSGEVDPQVLIDGGRNTIVYEHEPALQAELFRLLSTAHSPESSAGALKDLLCCLPQVSGDIGYDKVFRVIIMQFMDAHSLDIRSVKKSCVHIVHPEDGRLIPFDTYNLFYRGDLERRVREIR